MSGDRLPKPPDYLRDVYESCWYVPSHDADNAQVIDELDNLLIENVWMRHVAPPPPGERGDQEELFVMRDERGRWKKAWWWQVCHADHPDAQPFMEIRYR